MTCTRLTIHGMGVFQISRCECESCDKRREESQAAYQKMKAYIDTQTHLKIKELTKNG